jgi:ABC-type multidrug transport system permease subunit
MIAGSTLLSLLVSVVIAGLIFWLIWWFVGYVNPPEPFNKVIRVILGLVALVYLINILLSISGHPVLIR